MNSEERDHLAQKVVSWFRRRPAASFSERDVWRDLGKSFSAVDDVRPVLVALEARGYLRAAPAETRPGPGRKPSPRWHVNLEMKGDPPTEHPEPSFFGELVARLSELTERVSSLERELADQRLLSAELNAELQAGPVIVWDPDADAAEREREFEESHRPRRRAR